VVRVPSARAIRSTPSDHVSRTPKVSVVDGWPAAAGMRLRTLTRAPTSEGVIRTT